MGIFVQTNRDSIEFPAKRLVGHFLHLCTLEDALMEVPPWFSGKAHILKTSSKNMSKAPESCASWLVGSSHLS